jgi:hypothetical protein
VELFFTWSLIVCGIGRRKIFADDLDRENFVNRLEDVLKWFGRIEGSAKQAYRTFVKKGIDLGQRPEPVGGGLIQLLPQQLGRQARSINHVFYRRRAIGNEDVGGEVIDQVTCGLLAEIGDFAKIEQDPAAGTQRQSLQSFGPIL